MIFNGKGFRRLSGAQYSGEVVPGDLDGMSVLDGDANDFIRDTYGVLCARAMTLYHTCSPVIGAINKHTEYAIGDGLEFKSMPLYETLGMSEEEGNKWGEEFGTLLYSEMERLNFFEKQAVLFRSALAGGDSVLLFLREEEGFDLIECPGSIIDWRKNIAYAENEGVTLGIIHDKFYRRRGYYDVDGNRIDFTDKSGRQNAVMFYLKRNARQLRGFPLCYSAINLAKNYARHSEATLDTAILESTLFGETQTNDPAQTRKQIENLARDSRKHQGIVSRMLETFGSVSRLKPGTMLNLNTGETIKPLDKKTPASTYGMFKEWTMTEFGMATNTPPEVVMSKYGTAYTAHKGALNDFQKVFMKERGTFIQTVCEAVKKEILTNLILEGRIKAPGFLSGAPDVKRAYLNGKWEGPKLSHINPSQEVLADITSVNNGFELRSDKLFSRGGMSYTAFVNRWAAEEDIFKKTAPPVTETIEVESEKEEREEEKEETEETEKEPEQEEPEGEEGEDDNE